MAFLSGIFIIDAPAAALNNAGADAGAKTDNTVQVKAIRTKDGYYPYVSAQAFRYWLRTTLEQADLGWVAAPIQREEKIAYTAADPLQYWDDDLFGYMRTSKGKGNTLTRLSPFRVSTLVSLAPVSITQDFGVMARHEGDPVPFEHQFYHATLKGLFSLDLHACGTFSYINRTGFLNLDEPRLQEAAAIEGIQHLEKEKSYRLPLAERLQRITTLLEGMERLSGGAKQTLHYTDVSPAIVILAIVKGGNNLFNYIIGANPRNQPQVNIPALEEALQVCAPQLLSDVFIGWKQGYLDEERARLEEFIRQQDEGRMRQLHLLHPSQAFASLAAMLGEKEHQNWLA